MGKISLEHEGYSGVTPVSNSFIDNYMLSANGEYVKIYLYLLRMLSSNERDFSVTEIADMLEHTEKDVLRALLYWEREGLMQLAYDENKSLSGVVILNSSTLGNTPPGGGRRTESLSLSSTSPAPKVNRGTQPEVKATDQAITYTRDQLADFAEKEDISSLLYVAEGLLKHPITRTELNSFLYWYDSLEFSSDLIEYLVEYCIERGHSSIHYMEKVALSWAEIGIRTVDQAKKNTNLHNRTHYAVMKALGIKGRNLVELEASMIRKWSEDYAFPLDIIEEACTRTIMATHTSSFEYTDAILTNWHNAGVKELSDLTSIDAAHEKKAAKKTCNTQAKNKVSNNQFTDFAQRSYDYDQLEKQLLNRSQL